VNLPIDGIGILLAVDAIPDMFRTTANVTGSMALSAALCRQGEVLQGSTKPLVLTTTKVIVDNAADETPAP
jgi:Na+/H+-dicarboxylate symporter